MLWCVFNPGLVVKETYDDGLLYLAVVWQDKSRTFDECGRDVEELVRKELKNAAIASFDAITDFVLVPYTQIRTHTHTRIHTHACTNTVWMDC